MILVEASGLNRIPAYESLRPVLVILLYVALLVPVLWPGAAIWRTVLCCAPWNIWMMWRMRRRRWPIRMKRLIMFCRMPWKRSRRTLNQVRRAVHCQRKGGEGSGSPKG